MAGEQSRNSGDKDLCLRVLGTPISVHLDAGMTDDLRADLLRAWSRCLDHSGEPVISPRMDRSPEVDHPERIVFRGRVSSNGGTAYVAGQNFSEFASTLTSNVTRAGIAAAEGTLLMLHAAGLADVETGRTVALVGRSGMGKTTATRLLGAGFGYITDETVALDDSGAIVPYAKPLSVITQEFPAPKQQIGPDELGLLDAPAAPTLGSVVLLDRDSEAEDPLVTPLTLQEAIIEIAPQTSSLGAISRPIQRLCKILDATGGAVRVTYREAADLALVLPTLMERPPVRKAWKSALEQPAQHIGGRSQHSLPRPGAVRRAELIDAVEMRAPDGQGMELVVMTTQGIFQLAGVGPAVWHALATPGDIEEIAERIAPQVGLPSGYAAHLMTVVEELRSREILISA